MNEVETRCPKCGESHTLQSRVGDHDFRTYNEEDVPACVAEDLKGERLFCSRCESELEVAVQTMVVFRLKVV